MSENEINSYEKLNELISDRQNYEEKLIFHCVMH